MPLLSKDQIIGYPHESFDDDDDDQMNSSNNNSPMINYGNDTDIDVYNVNEMFPAVYAKE